MESPRSVVRPIIRKASNTVFQSSVEVVHRGFCFSQRRNLLRKDALRFDVPLMISKQNLLPREYNEKILVDQLTRKSNSTTSIDKAESKDLARYSHFETATGIPSWVFECCEYGGI